MTPDRVDPEDLWPETQRALMVLKRCLATEALRHGWRGVQVTYDDVSVWDVPPTVDIKVI